MVFQLVHHVLSQVQEPRLSSGCRPVFVADFVISHTYCSAPIPNQCPCIVGGGSGDGRSRWEFTPSPVWRHLFFTGVCSSLCAQRLLMPGKKAEEGGSCSIVHCCWMSTGATVVGQFSETNPAKTAFWGQTLCRECPSVSCETSGLSHHATLYRGVFEEAVIHLW